MKPTLDEFTEFVKNYPKGIGLGLLYKKYNVHKKPYEQRKKYREAWDLINGSIRPESGNVVEPETTEETQDVAENEAQ